MKNFSILFAICCIVSSCATLVNKDSVDLTLYSQVPAQIIYKDKYNKIDTFGIDTSAYRIIKVNRDNKSLLLQVKTDSITKASFIPRKYDELFYTGFITFYGAVIDYICGLNNKKIYTYNSPLMIDKDLNIKKANIKKLPPYNKGDLYLDFSFPAINHFDFVPNKENRKTQLRVLGISTGLDYYYQNNRFLSINAGMTFPSLAYYDQAFPYYDYTDKSASTAHVYISHNNRINRFSLGYGLSMNFHYWKYEKGTVLADKETFIYKYHRSSSVHYKNRDHQSLGTIFTANYYFTNSFYSGIIYRPSFIRFNTDKTFEYEHLLSITLGFKIKLKKGKN